MASDITLSVVEALQMVAILPSVLVGIYLAVTARNKKTVIIPVLYFTAIALGLIYYLLPAFIKYSQYPNLQTMLMMADILIPSLSFLFIFQLLLNRPPPALYYIVLIVPLVTIYPVAYYMGESADACLSMDICIPANKLLYLHNIIISLLVFMLLVFIVARKAAEITGDSEVKKNKYWLVISLIIFNILLLAIDLGFVADYVTYDKYVLSKTALKIAFIYMVITSVFRVFTDLFSINHIKLPHHKEGLSKYEQELAKKAGIWMEEKKIYRQSGLNREKMAEIMGISEHLLSRVINYEFKKSFSDLANGYRVMEARELLEKSDKAVTTIAFDVGFNSIASFNRVFKNITGKSPSKYRDDIKKDII